MSGTNRTGLSPPSFTALHDGTLTSISVAERSATLGLSHGDGRSFALVLKGVDALSVENFREGNIVMDLWAVTGPTFLNDAALAEPDYAEIMEILFPGPHPSAAAEYHDRHQSFLGQKRDKLERGEATLVILEPAYGADVVAFCASAELAGPC